MSTYALIESGLRRDQERIAELHKCSASTTEEALLQLTSFAVRDALAAVERAHAEHNRAVHLRRSA